MHPKQGEIYWVDIPAAQTEGAEQYGRRPFIVMSRDALNAVVKTVTVVPMTTHQNQAAIANQAPYRIVIPVAEITKEVGCMTQLAPISVAKTDQARAIDQARLLQKIGKLSQTAVIAVGSGLAFVFDIR